MNNNIKRNYQISNKEIEYEVEEYINETNAKNNIERKKLQKPKRGDICIVKNPLYCFDGKETRHAVIISNDFINTYSNSRIILPCTSRTTHDEYRINVKLPNNSNARVINNSIHTIPAEDVIRIIKQLSPSEIQEIDSALDDVLNISGMTRLNNNLDSLEREALELIKNIKLQVDRIQSIKHFMNLPEAYMISIKSLDPNNYEAVKAAIGSSMKNELIKEQNTLKEIIGKGNHVVKPFQINNAKMAETIIEYFKNHSISETSKYFGISEEDAKAIIEKAGLVDAEEIKEEETKSVDNDKYKIVTTDSISSDSVPKIKSKKYYNSLGSRTPAYIPEQDKEEIIEYYKSHSMKEVSEYFNISMSTSRTIIKDSGYRKIIRDNAKPSKRTKNIITSVENLNSSITTSQIDPSIKEEIVEFYKTHTINDIVDTYNISEVCAKNIIRKSDFRKRNKLTPDQSKTIEEEAYNILKYYDIHSTKETIRKYKSIGLTSSSLRKLLKEHNRYKNVKRAKRK